MYTWARDLPLQEAETETEMKCTKMIPYVPAAKTRSYVPAVKMTCVSQNNLLTTWISIFCSM